MRIGQLITSFLQGKVNPTMTSTIFSRYVDHVMEESKTGYFNALRGATLGTNRGGIKTVGGTQWARHWARLLAPRKKPKHKATWIRYGWRSQVLWLRLTWRSHWQPQLKKKLAERTNFGRK